MATRKVKRYGGNDESVTSSSPDPLEAANNSEESQSIAKEAATAAPKAMPSFKEAFASARRGGEKTFEWNGKKFTTELATAPAKKSESAAPAKAESTKAEPAKAPLRQETMQDRAERYVAKRAAQRAEDAAAKAAPSPGRGRIDTAKVNPKTLLPMKKGGVTASRRADGIASRGKTRCKIY